MGGAPPFDFSPTKFLATLLPENRRPLAQGLVAKKGIGIAPVAAAFTATMPGERGRRGRRGGGRL